MNPEPVFNDVITLPQVGKTIGCHLRIWRLPERTIVVAGQLKELRTPQGLIEQCVSEIARIYLPSGENFEFYVHYPQSDDRGYRSPICQTSFEIRDEERRGAALVSRIGGLGGGLAPAIEETAARSCAFLHPQWLDMSLPELRERTGLSLEDFPATTYTSGNVKEWLKHGGGREIVRDPAHLNDYVGHLRTLDSALSGAPDSTTADVMLAAMDELAYMAVGIDMWYASQSAELRDDGPLPEVRPRLSAADRDLATYWREHTGDRVFNNKAVHTAISELAETLVTRNPADRAALGVAEALRYANREIEWLLRLSGEISDTKLGPAYITSTAMRVLGAADADYLETVEWSGDGMNDATSFFPEALRSLHEKVFTDDKCRRLRLGTDPFGRKVAQWTGKVAHWTGAARNERDEALFVVEWPCLFPDSRYPDDADILASKDPYGNEGGRPVYVRLPDGTHDLLPSADEKFYPPPFTWGYGGTGPTRLETAIAGAYRGPDTNDDDHGGWWWLENLIETYSKDQDLEINVGEVRRRFRSGE